MSRIVSNTHAERLLCLRAAVQPRLCSFTTLQRRGVSFRLFDKLIPEDDPATKAKKDKEREIVRAKINRSKFAEVFSAAKEKVPAQSATQDATEQFPSLADQLQSVATGASLDPASLFADAPVTVVALAFQGIGQSHVAQWVDAFSQLFPASLGSGSEGFRRGSGAEPQLLNIVYVEGWLFRALSSLVTRSIRQALPPNIGGQTGVVYQTSEKATDYFCDALHIRNRVMGHVFLVDRAGFVRWGAHSSPAEGEVTAMYTAIKTLCEADIAGLTAAKR